MSDRGTCTFVAETHAYAIDGEPAMAVTDVLTWGGIDGDTYTRVRQIRPATLEYARERGDRVDLACDLIDQGVLDWDHLRAEAPVLVPYAEAWQRFRETEPYQPDGPRLLDGVPTFARRVWSKELGVAGTMDTSGTWAGPPCVVDRKAVDKVFWHYGVQLAGYAVLWLLGDDVPLGASMRKAFAQVGRRVVQLGMQHRVRGCACRGCYGRLGYHVVEYADPEDLDLFASALTIARAKKARARGPLPMEMEG